MAILRPFLAIFSCVYVNVSQNSDSDGHFEVISGCNFQLEVSVISKQSIAKLATSNFVRQQVQKNASLTVLNVPT